MARRESRYLKDKEELSNGLLVALPVACVWSSKVLLVYSEEGWTVQHWEQRLPFLEEKI
jgi:hypothetical protein